MWNSRDLNLDLGAGGLISEQLTTASDPVFSGCWEMALAVVGPEDVPSIHFKAGLCRHAGFPEGND